MPPGAEAHLRACASCRGLVAVFEQSGIEPKLSREAERRYVAAAIADLEPVSALAPAWQYAAVILAAAAIVAVAGIAVLGRTGWATSSAFQKGYFTILLAAGIVAFATVLSRLMIPGELPRVPLGLQAAMAMILLFAGALSYPLAQYEHFGRAAAACFAIGTLHASAAAVLCVVVLRRGFVVSPVIAAAVAGLTGGLTGFVVLFVFCPHHDAGHYLLAHVSMVVFATVAGPVVVHAWELVRNRR